jgi:hypothetical protein
MPFGTWFPAFAGTLSGSRLASAAAGLGRDDELPESLLRAEDTCSYHAELNTYADPLFRRPIILHNLLLLLGKQLNGIYNLVVNMIAADGFVDPILL